ncbi:MAG: AAA family ATPase [Chloroflexota bacterium]
MAQPIQPSTPTFRKLIEDGYLYVDKTRYIYDLVHRPSGIYFLSRPRRFGKSLLISTLEELFKGNRTLFQGLWIDESDYDWQAYPVIHLDFSTERAETAEELKEVIETYLDGIAEDYDLSLKDEPYQRRFRRLIRQLSQTTDKKQVVILIDEYDAPLLDHIDNIEEAKKIQKVMKAFYGVIKAMDRYIRFVLITGVSKFTRVTIFSELNHLVELTMSTSFGTALGMTEQELRDNLGDHMTEFAAQEGITSEELLDKIRFWYNGFCFAPNAENVYNPLMGLDIQAEVTTNVGRIDAVITLDDHIYIFEFKFNKTAKEALAQIHQRKYYQKYLSHAKPITLVGANFSQAAKGVDEWLSELHQPSNSNQLTGNTHENHKHRTTHSPCQPSRRLALCVSTHRQKHHGHW